MFEGWVYERLKAEERVLVQKMMEIDMRLSGRGRDSNGELKDQRAYAQWRARAVFAKQKMSMELAQLKGVLAVTPAPETSDHGRKFWRHMCRSMVVVVEAVRRSDDAPPELRQQAEGALSDLALALAAVPEDDDEAVG